MTISILDPRLWLTFILSFAVAFGIGSHTGSAQQKRENEIEVARLNLEARQKYDDLQDRSDRISAELRLMVDQRVVEFEKERRNAQAQIDSLRRDIVSGAYRLSVPVASCSTTPFSANSRASGGTADTARAELLPTTAIDLIDLAADADTEVRRTNLCINAYAEIKRQFEEYRNGISRFDGQ